MLWLLDQDREPMFSRREWSEAAGLSPNHVSTYLQRSEKNKATDIGLAALLALAKTIRASFLWLATGEGEPFSEGVATTPKERAMQRMYEDALEYGRFEATRAYLSRPEVVTDQGLAGWHTDEWYDYLRSAMQGAALARRIEAKHKAAKKPIEGPR